MGVVRELVGPGPLSDFLALTAGTVGPQMFMKVLGKARQLVANVTGQVPEEQLQQKIGEQFNTMTTPDAIQRGIDKTGTIKQDIPLFNPTTGQTSGSPGLIQSERAFQRTSSQHTEKAKITLESNRNAVGEFLRAGTPEGKLADTVQALEGAFTRETAMVDSSLMRAQAHVDAAKQQVSVATDRILQQADTRAQRAEQAAQDRINALSGRITKSEAGGILRDEYAKELAAFDTEASARYGGLQDFLLPTQSLEKRIRDIQTDFGVEIQGPAAAGLSKLKKILPEPATPERTPAGFLAQEQRTTEPRTTFEVSTTFHELHQARNEVRRLKREAIGAHDFKSSYQLGRINDAIVETMDEVKISPPAGSEGVVDALKDVDTWYAKQVGRLKSGEINALRFKDKWGRFSTYDEDVAGKFLKGETPVNDFVQALGGRPAAKQALEDFTVQSFIEKAIYPDLHPQAGTVNQAAASRFVQRHDAALKLFPEVREKIASTVQWDAIAEKYRAQSDALLKNPDKSTRIQNPKVYAELDAVTRQQSDLLDLRDRTVKDWQKSVASDLMGLDAERSAQAIVRSTKPNAIIADLNKKIGPNPDGQNGLNKALWDAALDKSSADRIDLMGNRALVANKMNKFLRENEDWMTTRFGTDRVGRMRKSADALSILESTGRPVLPGGSDTFANIGSAMVDWGPFFSRLYAEQSGRIGTNWLVSERIGRVVGGILKTRSESTVAELLERAFYEPQVAQTWMLAAKQANLKEMEQRLRHLVIPKSFIGVQAVTQGQQEQGN